MNALIHRDYKVMGAEIHVDLFVNRLEITSSGGISGGTLIQKMDLCQVLSMCRNQAISDVFTKLRMMERRGSGIGRILSGHV